MASLKSGESLQRVWVKASGEEKQYILAGPENENIWDFMLRVLRAVHKSGIALIFPAKLYLQDQDDSYQL
ncbi:MAG: hypothetical protein U5K69_24480 [Balneolaceae bacterium]|nr:hypothetical protein [Balneolaceae bacterium]